MNALMNLLGNTATIEASVRNKKLMKNVTIEEYEKDGKTMSFCKGFDKNGLLHESVLVSEHSFTSADYVALVNVQSSDKGMKASQVFKLTKKEFEDLMVEQNII